MTDKQQTPSLYRPSTMGALAKCRWFKSSSKDTVFNLEGTALHEAIEDPTKPRDQFDDYQLSLLSMIEGFVENRQKEIGQPVEVFKELEVDLKFLDIPGFNRGFADLVIWNPKTKTIYLFDWKFGVMEVDDAEDNWQQKIYSIGLLEKFPTATSCWVHLLQPKRDEISICEWTREQAKRLTAELKQLVAEVRDKENHPPVITEKGCAFCELKGKCSAYESKGINFMESHIVTAPFNALVFKKSALEMTPSERGLVFEGLKVVEEWIKAKKADVTSCAQEGAEVEGFALKKVAGKRSIEDASIAFKALPNADPMAFMKECSMSITTFEKFAHEVFSKDKPKQTKKESKAMAEELLAESGTLVQEMGYSYLTREK